MTGIPGTLRAQPQPSSARGHLAYNLAERLTLPDAMLLLGRET